MGKTRLNQSKLVSVCVGEGLQSPVSLMKLTPPRDDPRVCVLTEGTGNGRDMIKTSREKTLEDHINVSFLHRILKSKLEVRISK